MPFIKFEIWPGTTKKQRQEIAEGVTEVVRNVLDVPKDVVSVVFNEIPKDRWAVGGRLVDDKT